MKVPEQFAKELENRFHGLFRLRWSDKLHEFHVEQKIGVGHPEVEPPIDSADGTYDTYDDRWQRAIDGYVYVMSIRAGDRMPCPVCGNTLKVPVMETAEVKCFRCELGGFDGHYMAGYYPLNHVLIQRLEFLNPMTGGPERVRRKMRDRQLAKMAGERKELFDNAELATIDDKYQVEHRPMVGYGESKSRNVMDW